MAPMPDVVLVVCDDLLFWARIHDAARRLGRPVLRVSSETGMEQALREGGVRRVLADLGARSVDAIGWAARWKAAANPPEVVGFVSHVNVDARERALEAGFDSVLTNSQLVGRLETLL